ncbi:hypothetical protein LSTR_LSTR004102 [Laodelphax striatellus]|uniref:Odorant receptor n=1 Tax=Laodelphax striatellus TaxID=195883 RepID=A0A482WGQ1_LAOST|nr:hypothetical protein LSTR_LSTR004102 [Laodelphax striatellus]
MRSEREGKWIKSEDPRKKRLVTRRMYDGIYRRSKKGLKLVSEKRDEWIGRRDQKEYEMGEFKQQLTEKNPPPEFGDKKSTGKFPEEPITEESLLLAFGDKRITGKLGILFFALTWMLQINLIFCLTYEWPDFLNRILTMKEILMSCFATSGYFVQNHLLILENDVVKRYLEDVKYQNTSRERNRIIGETNEFIKWFSVVSIRAFKMMFIFGGCLPLLQVIIFLTKSYFTGSELKHVPFVVFVYVPERFRTIPGYLTAQILAFSWYGLVSYMWGVSYKVYLSSIRCVETEMQLLCQSLEEIGMMSGSGNESVLVYKSDTEKVQGNEEEKLRQFFSSIIQHHQHILRLVSLLSKHLRLVIVTFINIYGLQTCLYMIFLLKMKETGIRMKYGIIYCVILVIMYSCTKSGQDIKNKAQASIAAFNSWKFYAKMTAGGLPCAKLISAIARLQFGVRRDIITSMASLTKEHWSCDHFIPELRQAEVSYGFSHIEPWRISVQLTI